MLFADFFDGLHLSLFREPVEIFSERLPSGLYRVLPKFKIQKRKKTFKPVLTWSTGRYAPGYCWFSHDVTKIQTTILSILPRFYFDDVLEQLKIIFYKSFRFKRVLGFVIGYA